MRGEFDHKTSRPIERVGKYEILGHIATGGMGDVYKARDADLDRIVALKILRTDLAKEEKIRVRFRREATASAQLRHENIVAIYDVGEHEGTHFLAFEYVEGTDLEHYIERKSRLEPEQARQILIHATRALIHAHQHRIVHRDIKPSNFLLSFKDGRLTVKLTDFGLALRSEDDERQFRITKDGTTVGTVDYMSPEQARDSQSADIRSDIYSLGCTFFHMLDGSAPFAHGSLPERLIHHMQKAPPDVRRINKAVPETYVTIISRMLAKKPNDRYQTPADLLKDLENHEMIPPPLSKRSVTEPAAPRSQKATRTVEADVTAEVAHKAAAKETAERKAPKPAPPKKEELADTLLESPRLLPRRPKKTPPPDPPSKDEKPARHDDTPDEDDAPSSVRKPKKGSKAKPTWWTYAPLAGIGVLVLFLLIAISIGGRSTPTKKTEQPITQAPAPPPVIQEASIEAPPVLVDTSPAKMTVEPLALPTIDSLTPKVDRTALIKEYSGPFTAFPQAPVGSRILELRRLGVSGPSVCRTLAEAFARAAPDGWTVIEIHDNGPLHIPPLPALNQQSVVLRGAPGYRPLLAWEVAKPSGKDKPAATWLALSRGKLVLDNLDVVMKWTDKQPAALFDLGDADFYASDCTFSSAGKAPQGLTLVRHRGLSKEVRSDAPSQAWLRRCYVRGADVTLSDVSNTSAALFLDGSLVVGQRQPLFNVSQRDEDVLQWHAIRSTIVAGQEALRWRSAAGKKGTPLVSAWILDSILARDDPLAPVGDMVRLVDSAEPTKIAWKAANSVYAGWKRLLACEARNIDGGDLTSWHGEWHYSQGDRALVDCWPSNPPARIEEALPTLFSPPVDAPVSFAALTHHGNIGCIIGRLGHVPMSWEESVFDPPAPPITTIVHNNAPPAIDVVSDGLYHGEKLDLNKIDDLGAHVQTLLQKAKPAPRVVFHLRGSGTRLTSPMHFKGIKNLVLYFEPNKDVKAPLRLGANPASIAQRAPLIEVNDGNLELIGADIQLSPITLVPAIVKVHGGDLKLTRCRLQGPLHKDADSFDAVIAVGSSGGGAVNLTMRDCVVLSGKLLLRLKDQVHWSARNNVFVSLGDGVHYEATGTTPPLQHVLDHNTWAVRKTTFVVQTPPGFSPAAPLVLYANCNAFLNPFVPDGSETVLLRGAADAVSHGQWMWRARFNVYDARLQAYFAPAKSAAGKQPLNDWKAAWGSVGEQDSLPLTPAAPTAKTLIAVDTAASTLVNQLDRLALPRLLRGDPAQAPPGADLIALKIVGKKG